MGWPALDADDYVLDGEVCALDHRGVPSRRRLRLTSVAAIEARRKALQRVAGAIDRKGSIIVSTASDGDPRTILAVTCERDLRDDAWNIHTVLERLRQRGPSRAGGRRSARKDPWAGYFSARQRLPRTA